WELATWQVCCAPVATVIPTLNDLHFAALQGLEGFQLGADLLFWWQLGQELKGVIAADQYIPALRYRALPQKGKKQPHFELYPSWEIVSERYEALVRRYAACMPAVCAAGSESAGRTDLFEPES